MRVAFPFVAGWLLALLTATAAFGDPYPGVRIDGVRVGPGGRDVQMRIACPPRTQSTPRPGDFSFCTGTLVISMRGRIVARGPFSVRTFDSHLEHFDAVRGGAARLRRGSRVRVGWRAVSHDGQGRYAAGRGSATLASAASASAAYRVTREWGQLGTGPGQFGSGVLGGDALRQYDDPAGIAVAADGTVFVVDTSNNRVQRFTAAGAFRGSFGRRGRDNGAIEHVIARDRFYQPEGIAAAGNGLVYVVDSGNDRVMAWTAAGRFRQRLGYHGSTRGEWVQPWGVAASRRALWVVDQGNYRVQRWSLSGRYLGAFGSFGRGAGQFVTPYGIAVTRGGELVYVADAIRRKVIGFTGTGRFLGEFGSSGTEPGRFLRPTGVAVGPDGSVFVADRCNDRIDRFTATGAYLESFGAGVLLGPTFVAVARNGSVYVSDHHRVVVFAPSAALRAPARASSHDGRGDVACSGVR